MAWAEDRVSHEEMRALAEAFALFEAGDYNRAATAYQVLEESPQATPALRRAALGGRLMSELGGLRAVQSEGRTGFLERNRVDKVLRLAAPEVEESDSFTYAYLDAVAQGEGALDSTSFAGTALERDYALLADRIANAPAADDPVIAKTASPPLPEAVAAAVPAPEAAPAAQAPAAVDAGPRVLYFRVATAVNVRTGPGTMFEKMGSLPEGRVVRALETVTTDRGERWVMLADNAGYVHANFVQEIAAPADAPVDTPPEPQSGSCGASVIGEFEVTAPMNILAAPSPAAEIIGTLRPGDILSARAQRGGYLGFRVDDKCWFVEARQDSLRPR
jgi:hypothetical protein